MQWSAAQQETPGFESTGPLCESFTCPARKPEAAEKALSDYVPNVQWVAKREIEGAPGSRCNSPVGIAHRQYYVTQLGLLHCSVKS